MSTPITYPDEKQERVSGYADVPDSDGEGSHSFTALIAEGENSNSFNPAHAKSVHASLTSMLFASFYRSTT